MKAIENKLQIKVTLLNKIKINSNRKSINNKYKKNINSNLNNFKFQILIRKIVS